MESAKLNSFFVLLVERQLIPLAANVNIVV